MTRRATFWLGMAAAASVLAFAAIVVAADRGSVPRPIAALYDWPGGDKVGHIVLLAGLTFLLSLALRGRTFRLWRWTLGVAPALLATAITLEEASQAYFPSRTLDAVDLACSYLGIFLGSRAAAAVLSRARDAGVGRRASR